MRLSDEHIYQIAKHTKRTIPDVREAIRRFGHLGLWRVLQELDVELAPVHVPTNCDNVIELKRC